MFPDPRKSSRETDGADCFQFIRVMNNFCFNGFWFIVRTVTMGQNTRLNVLDLVTRKTKIF